jgi:hypothetical protein
VLAVDNPRASCDPCVVCWLWRGKARGKKGGELKNMTIATTTKKKKEEKRKKRKNCKLMTQLGSFKFAIGVEGGETKIRKETRARGGDGLSNESEAAQAPGSSVSEWVSCNV